MDAGQGQRDRQAQCAIGRAGGGGEAAEAAEPHEPRLGAAGARGATAEEVVHLGPYRPLIAAIREELEQFATNQLRLHLAIAERDRYVLASIEVECEGSEEERELLRRFIREFRPEQIKHYLAKEVIAGLRNASAIDLSQFAGLNAEAEDDGASGDEERYGELIAELSSGMPRGAARAYRVTLLGRWSELDAPRSAADGRSPGLEGPRTPLAARALAIDIEDAGGARRVELAPVLPGRRYSVGKGEGCDIVVDGVYASRRHCEIWFDKGAWWVADTGSTNGIRVESADGVMARDQSDARSGARQPAIELPPGTWLVLAAHTQGEPRQYPRLSLRPDDAPLEAREASAPAILASTPVTPIAPPRRRERAWTITATHGVGRSNRRDSRRARCRSTSAARAIRRWSSIGHTQRFPGAISRSSRWTSRAPRSSSTATTASPSMEPCTGRAPNSAGRPGRRFASAHGTGKTAACTLTLSRTHERRKIP